MPLPRPLQGPSQEQEEETDKSTTTQFLTLSELQEIQKDFVTVPADLCILGVGHLRRGYFKDPKGYWWAFDIAATETEEIKQLSTFPGLLDSSSVVRLPKVEEQPITTTMTHWRQYHTNQNSVTPTHKLIHSVESQGVISRTCSHPSVTPYDSVKF